MLYLDSTTTIALSGLADVSSGSYINNAVVTATITDNDRNIIVTVDLTPAGTGGDYSGNIYPADTEDMQPQEEYCVTVTAALPVESVDETPPVVIDCRKETHTAQYRTFDD